jgi:Rps23 Pro-64 3,4-dihydroxylase Tpa1-like proline 4-hydroxylase
MIKNIKLDTINNDLWTRSNMLKLATHIFDSDMKIYRRLFYTQLFTRFIKEILVNILKIDNDMILKIYWNEFKLIRKTFKESYDNITCQTMNSNIKDNIKKLFDKENIAFLESETVFDNIEQYVESSKNKECIQCKICYNQSVDHILVHDNQGCTICGECAEKFGSNTDCPFCKLKILDKKKLFIR